MAYSLKIELSDEVETSPTRSVAMERAKLAEAARFIAGQLEEGYESGQQSFYTWKIE